MLISISQNKLLSSKAKNPYAAYASSCSQCMTKTEQGRKYCQRCAYQKNGLSSFFSLLVFLSFVCKTRSLLTNVDI